MEKKWTYLNIFPKLNLFKQPYTDFQNLPKEQMMILDAVLLSKIGYTDYDKLKNSINCLILKEELLWSQLIILQYLFFPLLHLGIKLGTWLPNLPCLFDHVNSSQFSDSHYMKLEGVALNVGGSPFHIHLFASAWNLDIVSGY